MEKIFVTKASMPSYEEYIEAIKPLWDSHILTNMGAYHKKLEGKLNEFLKTERLSLMTNGHMALEMAIQSFDFPKGSEVITTPFTFISTTHAIVRNGLVPVFCDINYDNYTIDVDKIEALITEKTVAIVPVHVYGNVCNVEEIGRIAYKYGLKVIYDACHAFGEEVNNVGVGTFGDASVFSFHATKVFNTIEGGAVTFESPEMYEKLYNLKNFGIRDEELTVAIGANAKMNEFCAIMGLCNLKNVEENIALRKKNCEKYIESLNDCKNIKLPDFKAENVKRNYSYFYILLENENRRNAVYSALKEQNIFSRKYFYPITSEAACFRRKYSDVNLEVSKDISSRVLVLPLYPELEEENIKKISKIVAETCR